MMRKKMQHIWSRLFSRHMLRKIERDRQFRHGDIIIELYPGIFHPGYFKSSRLLLNWVDATPLEGKTVIEVGAGSGITSLSAAKKGADVWAIDINPAAVEQLQKNAESNDLKLTIRESDLFANVDEIVFDFVLINPPFYPKNPRNAAEKAWYCGEGFEYFHALFQQLKNRQQSQGILMTLSDGCDLERIQSIATEYGYSFAERQRIRSFFEVNFLFEVTRKPIEEL